MEDPNLVPLVSLSLVQYHLSIFRHNMSSSSAYIRLPQDADEDSTEPLLPKPTQTMPSTMKNRVKRAFGHPDHNIKTVSVGQWWKSLSNNPKQDVSAS